MSRPLAIATLLVILTLLALLSMAWGCEHALTTSKDLMSRWAEIDRFSRGEDPFQLPSMTYPPSALPVFATLVGPFGPESVRAFWLGLNLAFLVILCGAVVALWGQSWPLWLRAAVCLVVVACKPVRGGIALGQFHLIPTALMLLSVLALRARRQHIAGLLVGIALAKPTMVVPFLGFLVVRKQWRALAVALGVQAVFALGVSAWLGIGPARLIAEWLANARGQLAEGLIDLPSLVQQQWPAAPLGAGSISMAILAAGLALMVVFRRGSDLTLVSLAAYVAAVFSYHRPYDLVLLIPALADLIAVAYRANGRSGLAWRSAAIVFALLLIAPSHPSIAGQLERWHDRAFIVLAYGYLGLIIASLASSAHRATLSSPSLLVGLHPSKVDRRAGSPL
jgi:Glycosyltransferase family 87